MNGKNPPILYYLKDNIAAGFRTLFADIDFWGNTLLFTLADQNPKSLFEVNPKWKKISI